MTRIATLLEFSENWKSDGGRPDPARIEHLLNSPHDHDRIHGILGRSVQLLEQGGESAAFEYLLTARRLIGYYPIVVISNVIWLADRLNRRQEAAFECLQCAKDAAAMGYDDIGLEAAAAALMLDTQSEYAITRDPQRSRDVADFYEAVAQRQPPVILPPDVAGFAGGTAPTPIRVAMVVSNLVDHVVAYTKTVLHFARYLDPARYQLHVYSTENLAVRAVPLFPYGCIDYHSETAGREAIRECRERGIPVFLTPRSVSYLEAARTLIEQLARDRIDIAVFQSGLACPIDWLTARLAPVPVKAAIHIGSSLFNRGVDVTFFDNPANIARENEFWPVDGGRREVLRQGTDIDELDRQPPLDRARFGIPPEAVIVGTMSNHLARRLSEPYLEVVAAVLAAHPCAWFLAFGMDTLPEKMEYFRRRGVAERVRFGGRQTQPGSALKALDIYANEFPVGGSQSVIEAMACGVPVVAMRWSDAHAESAGAENVGADFAVAGCDPAAYRERIERWITDVDARRAAGRHCRQRAETCFSVQTYIHELISYTGRLLAEPRRADRRQN